MRAPPKPWAFRERTGLLLPAALLACVCLLAGCGAEQVGAQQAPDRSPEEWGDEFWNGVEAGRGEALRYRDLPGVEGFSHLSAEARAAALAAAHQLPCPCGCLDHTVAYCLNEDTGCLTVGTLAKRLVAEAAKRYRTAAEEPSPGGSPAPDPAEPSETATEDPQEPPQPAAVPDEVPASGPGPEDEESVER